MTIKTTWTALNLDEGEKEVKMPPKRYEMERITPPGKAEPWLVFKGTMIGRREKVWKHFLNSPDEIQITIEET